MLHMLRVFGCKPSNRSPPPPGQCDPQLRASRHQDAVLSVLLGPGGAEALPELLPERDARLPGQPGGLGHGVEQLPR